MSHNLLLLMFVFTWSRDAQAQVTGGSATVKLGDPAVLPCRLTRTLGTGEYVEQISWQRRTKGIPRLDNFLTIQEGDKAKFVNGEDKRFRFIGKFADQNGTLQLFNVNLQDEGTYSCIFSSFPFGSSKADIPLTVLVHPKASVNDSHPRLGDEEVSLATCTAADSKPPAEVVWYTGALKVKVATNSTLHVNGTTTTVSTLLGKPSKKIHRSPVHCVISFMEQNQTIPFDVQVYYPPLEVKLQEGSMKDQSITCEADANPNATVTWTRSGTPLPSSVTALGGTLMFKGKSSDLAGFYTCVANNTYGSKQNTLYVHFDSAACIDGWIAFILLLLVLIVGIGVFLYKKGSIQLPSCMRSSREEVQTSSPREGAVDFPLSPAESV
ncbi:nectin-1 isoform X1 [Fundulus heteroclitus]|uniref:nectin-1 isoform X1 n=1 Tax=Fundulus heteroclitus TaxID=8078 RepID=UPI00165B8DDD|nr:nectin-1 isoform X1 [Fundulus heteroclitus]